MRKTTIKKCSQCGETKKFYSNSDICAACVWWEKNHGEKRTGPIIIRDGMKTKYRKEYTALRGAKARCYNPNNPKYKNYGGRGIKICDRWLGPNGFHNFLNDMGEKPEPKNKYSLDRIDVNSDYCPENCRWADANIQGANKQNKRIYSEKVGVTYNKSIGYWIAVIQKDKKRYVRYCKTKEDAIAERINLEKLVLDIDVDD